MATISCRVILLDDSIIERDLEKRAVGQVLFDKVCEYLNLLERDYFGLTAWDSSNNKVWLDFSKRVHKQIISHDATFTFSVKFYPPDPSLLAEDITRYLLCLQLRTDILTSHLPCSSDMLPVLGSYTIQSEFGDYNPELHGKEFYSNIPLAPNQTPELEEKVIELHRTLKSMSPAEADQLFLQKVKTLHMYGVHLHPAKDASSGDVMLGVCADGLVVYEEDEENTQSFVWPAVLKMSYKRSNFQARILHSEDESENTIKFTLPSYRACKCLWRNAVEHQAFFRDLKDQDQAPKRLLHLGSRFRFNGLSHAEHLEASSTNKREAPHFARSAIKRKAKESLLLALKRPNRTEFVDWFQVLGSDEPWPTYSPDKYQLTAEEKETLAYKERQEVDELDNEWFQLLGGRFFPTQHSFLSLTSDTDILERDKFQLGKLQADDWFVLFEPHTYQPTYWHRKTLPLSPQSSQAEEQSEELEWIENTSGKTIKIVQIRKEVRTVTEQYEELEMERNLIRSDIVGENLEMEIGDNEQRLKSIREKIIGEGDGEEFQTVVMYEQRTQEVKLYTGQEEAFVEQRIKEMEVVDTVDELMFKTDQVVSKETIEDLEETLLEVESIEQKLQDIERLKVKLQEVEMLEQKLQEVQQAGRQREESDDWYILLEHKLMASSATVRWLGMKTSKQKMQDLKQEQQEREDRGDWYLLLDRKPSVASSARAGSTMDTTEQKAEIRQWIEEERQRANTLPVQMKDDWYILLDSLPRPTQTRQPALPPSEIEVQSSWVKVVEEHKNLGEETQWSEERAIPVTETQSTLPLQGEEQIHKQVDDDWFFQLSPSPKEAAVDVYKETREEKVQLVKKQVKTRTYEEEERRETTHEVVQMNPIPFERRAVSSGSTMDTTEQKAEIRQRIEEERQRANTLPVQMKDDWYILLDSLPRPTQTRQPALPPSVHATAVDVHKETREEEVQLVKKQVKTITYEEERQEMIETSHEGVQMNPIPFRKRAPPSGSTMDTTEQKAEIRQWIEEERQRANTLPVQMKDDWYILLDSLPRPTQTRQPALPPSVLTTAVDVYKKTREEEVQLVERQVKTIPYKEERREMIETSFGKHEGVQTNPVPFEKRHVPSGLRSQQTVTNTEKVTFDKKPMIPKEKQVIIRGAATVHDDKDNWFVLFTPAQIEKKATGTAGVSETWTLKEKRLKEVPKGRLRENVKRSHEVEDKRLHLYVSKPKAEARYREVIDDWFLLLEPVSKKSVSVDKRAEEERRRKEGLFKKQALAEDRRKVAVPVIPLTPAAQPMTSTPTAQSVRITRPTYQEKSLKRLDITQDITQDIKLESEVQTEIVISRKRREKRIENESIYIRHSILMLEDSDMTQEIVLKHHASISELKRIFMEDIPVFGPTEWDRRLSSYTPVIYPKLELFSGINLIGADGLSVM